MALNEAVTGAIISDLPFPLDETRPSDVTNYENLLGKAWKLDNGLSAILVQSDGAVTTPAKKCFKWQDIDAFEVELTGAAGDETCGIAHPNLPDLVADDYFFLLRPGEGNARVTCVDSGAGITAGDFVQGTADGDVITDAAYDSANPSTTIGQAISTAAADADVDVLLIPPIVGSNA